MYNRMVVTSGTSLLNNNRSLLESEFSNFFQVKERLTDESFSLSDKVIQYLSTQLLSLDKSDLDQISAEVSMVAVLQGREQLVKAPYITLFYTDSFRGRVAGLVNKKILEQVYGATVRMRKIYKLDVHNRTVLNRALGKYLSDISEALEEGEPNTTCFAPIGGYKVMTSLGHLVGNLHHYPTAYLYEGSTVVHEIPPVIVEINESLIKENHQLLKKFFDGDCFIYEELSPEEQAFIKEQSVMFEQVEELVALNPFGRFLCNQNKYYKYFKSKVYMEESLYREINRRYTSYWKTVYDEIKDLIFQHESNPADYRATLYHEPDFSQLDLKGSSYHLFKGGNNPVFRALWLYNEEDDAYYIAHIWFDHDVYKREATATIKRKKHKGNWINITEQLYS